MQGCQAVADKLVLVADVFGNIAHTDVLDKKERHGIKLVLFFLPEEETFIK